MKKKLLITLIAIIFLFSSGITAMALLNSTEEGYDSLLSETIDKFTPLSMGKKLKNITDSPDKTVVRYGRISVSEFELEYVKFQQEYVASYNKEEKTFSDEEIIDILLKQKLLIQDATSKGLSVPNDKVKQFLDGTRKGYTFDSQGNVTSNENFNKLLKSAGMTYDEFERNFICEGAKYYFLSVEYDKLLCQEKGFDYNSSEGISRFYQLREDRLNSLLMELKKNSN